jgi:hypothetical protein
LRYIDQALDWMALPVGPEMFDICGRSSLIFSRDIQGIWYGGWPYTYISLSCVMSSPYKSVRLHTLPDRPRRSHNNSLGTDGTG